MSSTLILILILIFTFSDVYLFFNLAKGFESMGQIFFSDRILMFVSTMTPSPSYFSIIRFSD